MSALLCCLAGSTLRAQDEAPVCIKEVNGEIRMVPGECPGFNAGGGGSYLEPSQPAAREKRAPTPGAKGSPAKSSASSRGKVASELKVIAGMADEREALQRFEVLVAQGPGLVPELSAVFLDAHADAQVRWVAGRALGRIRCRDASDALMQGLEDASPMARASAARALVDQGDRQAVPSLVRALPDAAAIVRAGVIDAIAALGGPSETRYIIAQLKAPYNFYRGKGLFVRAHAADALGQLGGQGAIPALIEVADDPDPDTKAAARRSLLKLSGLSAVPPGEGSDQARWMAWWKARGSR